MSGAQLNIIVIGAGIAGLGAAITLSRAGHNVTVGSATILTRFEGGADPE
jgi:monoamine oxidase